MTDRSYSEISTYQSCPRKWWLRYVQRRSGGLIPADRLVRGTTMHAWLAGWWGGNRVDYSEDPILRAMQKGYDARYGGRWMSTSKPTQVNVPFRVEVARDLFMVGEIDALATLEGGVDVIIEHKTAAGDIGLGATYWRRVSFTDRQVSVYSLAFPSAQYVLYDVLRKPDHARRMATPDDVRKYTKPTKADPVPRLYANQREADETDEELESRILSSMSEDPEKYFARSKIVRLEHETQATVRDLVLVDQRMRQAESALTSGLYDGEGVVERNPGSCHAYGDECEFFSVCWEGRPVDQLPAWDSDSYECQRGKGTQR